jgi:hypothetical protein
VPNNTLNRRVDALESETTSLRGEVNALRIEMRTGFAELRAADAEIIRAVEALHVEALRTMRELNHETRNHARVLHEEVIERISRIEGRRRRRKP